MSSPWMDHPLGRAPRGRFSRRFSLAAALSVAALSIVLLGTSAGAASHTIVVGNSIGPIHLAQSRGKVHHVYPHKYKAHFINQSDVWIERYKAGSLTVAYCCGKKNPHVVSIATISAEWITAEGITVGDSLERLQATYPVECQKDDPGPAGVIIACRLTTDNRHITTFNIDPTTNAIDGIHVYGTAGIVA
jgi:hypothetical protein